MFEPDGQDFTDWANKNATEFEGYSSAGENFDASVGQVIDEELSVSSLINRIGSDDRNDRIRSLAKEGMIGDEVMEMFRTRHERMGTRIDWDGVANYANDNLELEEHLDTDLELTEQRDMDLADRRAYRENIFGRSLTGGKVSQFAGGFVASGLDPVAMASMGLALPVAGVRQTTKAMYTLSMFGRGAAFNVAAAAPIEPFIHSWKDEIGAEYTLQDSMFNLGVSGLLGGTVVGIGANLGFKYKNKDTFIGKDRKSLVQAYKRLGLEDEDAEALGQFTYEANNAPDPDMPAKEFVERVEDTQERMEINRGQERDVESQIDTDSDELIQSMYDDVPEDLMMTLEDGTEISIKEHAATSKAEAEEINTIIGCLNG
jgi:hypothetical protein